MTDAPPPHPPADAPAALASLWSLAVRWATGDDLDRERRIESATSDELRELRDAVRPLLGDIDRYLDQTHDAAWALPFGDLAQAAIEADQELARRPG